MPRTGHFEKDWRKVKTIGQGAQGRTSLMQHKRSGELAVRKRMTEFGMVDDTPLEAIILQEILPPSTRINQLMAFTFETHRNGDTDLIQWFEYCRGGDLHHDTDQVGRLQEDFIWHCFIQIAEALDVIHNAGTQLVVHRDIKPDNIFLEQKYRHEAPWPNLKVGDFGTAVLEKHTQGVHVPCWHGPELPHLSPAGDIWSLGAIVHWLGHGLPPLIPPPVDFPGSSEQWCLRPEARKPEPLPHCYSNKLNERMLDCLEWDPKDRISSQKLVSRLKRDRPRTGRRG